MHLVPDSQFISCFSASAIPFPCFNTGNIEGVMVSQYTGSVLLALLSNALDTRQVPGLGGHFSVN